MVARNKGQVLNRNSQSRKYLHVCKTGRTGGCRPIRDPLVQKGRRKTIYRLFTDVVESSIQRGHEYEGQLWTKIKTHISLKVIRTQNSVCIRIRAHTARFWAA